LPGWTRNAAAGQGRHHWQVQSRDEREVIGSCRRDVAAKSFCAIDKEREHGRHILPLPFANVFLSRQLSFITSSSLFDLSFYFPRRERERRKTNVNKHTDTQQQGSSSRLWRRWLFQLTGAENKTKKFRNVQEKNWGHEKLKIKKADDFARFLNINRRRVVFPPNFLMNIYTRPDFITCVWRVSLTRRQLTRWPAQPLCAVQRFPPGADGIFVSRSILNSLTPRLVSYFSLYSPPSKRRWRHSPINAAALIIPS
jgi:hypothetical protein